MVVSFSIDVKRVRRDLKFSINAKGEVCWQGLQFALDMVLSLMSNFKSPKGEFVGHIAQARWFLIWRSACLSMYQNLKLLAYLLWVDRRKSICLSLMASSARR